MANKRQVLKSENTNTTTEITIDGHYAQYHDEAKMKQDKKGSFYRDEVHLNDLIPPEGELKNGQEVLAKNITSHILKGWGWSKR